MSDEAVNDDLLFASRLRHITYHSLEEMIPGDRVRRVALCRANGQHRIRMVAEDHGIPVGVGRPKAGAADRGC